MFQREAEIRSLRHAAHEDNQPEAQYRLGQMYEFGLMNERCQHTNARHYYQLAAYNNFPQAILRLGMAHEYGQLDLSVSFSDAIDYYLWGTLLDERKCEYRLGLLRGFLEKQPY